MDNKKRQKCVSTKEGRNCGWFDEVAKPVWGEGNLLLLRQSCWKDAVPFDTEKPPVQIWAISLQTFWQQEFLFFLKAVWCLISATGCCDSTQSYFWFKNTPLASPRRLLSLQTRGRNWRCSQCVSLSHWTITPGAQAMLLFLWTLISLQWLGLPGSRSEGMLLQWCICGISLGCASPLVKRRSTFCQRTQPHFTPDIWVTTAGWRVVTRIKVQAGDHSDEQKKPLWAFLSP